MYQSYLQARKGKRGKPGTIRFEINALESISYLIYWLNRRKYNMGNYLTFKVFEPKERIIMALPFSDKVVQQYLCDYILEPAMERHFIYDTYACRKKKGVHAGLNRLEYFMKRHYNRYGYDGWILKCDIKSFFYSIDHDVLKEMLFRLLNDHKGVHWIFEIIIDSTSNPGIPLGNQTSQWFANFYLSELDHFIKEKLRVKHYIRCADDFVLVHNDKNYLRYCLVEIQKYVEDKLKLQLNQKTHIFPLHNGVDFLGFHMYLTKTGKVVRKIRRNSKTKMRRKIKKFNTMLDEGKISKSAIDRSFQSWLNHASHGNCFHLTTKMITYYNDTFKKGDVNDSGNIESKSRRQG